MRDTETFAVDLLITVEENIQVQGTRPPVALANPLVRLFERLQLIEQRFGVQMGTQFGYGVDEIRLILGAYRVGTVQ